MRNLYEETLGKLEWIKKTVEDIDWIGSDKYTVPVEKMKEAFDLEYNAGYGTQMIDEKLVIVFKDGSWLERAEYDGSEWWSYKKHPEKPIDVSETNWNIY